MKLPRCFFQQKISKEDKKWLHIRVAAFWSSTITKKEWRELLINQDRCFIEDSVAYLSPRVFIYHFGKRNFIKYYPLMREKIRDIHIFKGDIYLAKRKKLYDRCWRVMQ